MPDLTPHDTSPAPGPETSPTTGGEATRAVRVRVTGQVQGVFFRASTRDLAQQHGATGWVRNDPDGAVTAVLEGTPGAVDAVLGWMRDGGPPRARVDQVHVEEAPVEGHVRFDVRR